MLMPSLKKRIQTAHNLLSGWLEPDSKVVQELQLRKLQEIYVDATKNVPYYHKLVSSGNAPPTIVSLEQFFAEVPMLQKKDIQKNRDDFVRLDKRPDLFRATGGSTGEPLQFGVFRSELELGTPDALVGRMGNGMDLEKDRFFIFFGYSYLLGTGWVGLRNHMVRKVLDFFANYRRRDAYFLDSKSLDRTLRDILRFRPQVLYGYSSAIDALARNAKSKPELSEELNLKLIITTAEPLPREDSRSLIESVFGAKVVMEYGGVDFGTVAYERPSCGYHVFWWNQLVEAHGPEENNTPLNLYLTCLYPRYLPLIRYESGDMISGVVQPKAHGILSFDAIEGRVNDVVKIGDSHIHSVALAHCIKDEASIANIQIVLEPYAIRVLLVGIEDKKVERRIRTRMKDLSSELADCMVEFREDLETTPAGKRRWVVDRRDSQR
jgi:phenylacetate-CoA ligase